VINKEFTPRIRARQVTAQTDILVFMTLFFLSLFVWTNVALSQTEAPAPTIAAEPTKTFEENYKDGVQFFQSKSYDKAQSSFQNALLLNSHSISTLTNLGLVSFELGNKGLALAYLRRALEIDGDFSPAKMAFDYIWSQLEVKEIPHRIETYETLRKNFLSPFSLSEYLWFGGLCFFFAGWLIIRYLGQNQFHS
jgi:tetratricopeptide (TPR) repeat protein